MTSNESNAMHLFTYGSLMFSPVWQRVVRGTYQSRSAVLTGYIRKAVRGATYPVIFPMTAKNEVAGRVYFDVASDDMERLDRFEGDYYQRLREELRLPDGQIVAAEVYVLKDTYRSIASEQDWDIQRFEQEGLNTFLNSYLGFDEVSPRS